MKTTIVLTDDHSIVRDGIRSLLETENDLEVIGEGSNGFEAIELVHSKTPDILIIDIRMPELNGIDAVSQLELDTLPTKCIILSMHDSEEYILKSIQAGAKGYLLKDTGKAEFLKAIHIVKNGGTYYSGDISQVLVNNVLNSENSNTLAQKKVTAKTPFDLTKKELQILSLILEGMTNQQVSEKLNNSKRTVETHRFNLMRKMEVKNLLDLSKKAQLHKLV